MALLKDYKLNIFSSTKDGSKVGYTAIVNGITDGETEKSYNIVVDLKEIDKLKEHKLNYLSKTSNIDGFRPGKAPVSMIWKRHKDALSYEIIDEIVNGSINQLAIDEKVDVRLNPKLSNESFDLESQIKFDVSLIFISAFDLPDFKSLSIEKPVFEVTDKEIAGKVEELLKKHTKSEKADAKHKAASGDSVVIDFEGKIDGVAFPGGAAKGHTLVLGTKSFIDNFEDQLIGKKAGDSLVVKVKFPEEYHAKEFAGKPAEFDVTIHEILQAKQYENEEELAKGLQVESAEELRKQLKVLVEHECNAAQQVKMKTSLLDELDKVFSIKLPQVMLDEEYEALVKHLSEEDKKDKTEKQLKDEYSKIANRRVKLGILLAEIANRNAIKVDQKDLQREIYSRAMNSNNQAYADALIKYYTNNPQAVEQLKGPIIEAKTVAYLFEQVPNVEKKVTVKKLLDFKED